MREQDGPRDAGRLARLSLRKLGAYAMEEELIEGIEIRPDRVTIVQGDNRFVLPPDQASTFLIGMLRGRSWFIEEDTFTTPADLNGDPPAAASVNPTLEATVDSLLAFTKEAGILEDYEKEPETQTVRIDIPACSTRLSYNDAVGYLLDCIQHELRSLRREE